MRKFAGMYAVHFFAFCVVSIGLLNVIGVSIGSEILVRIAHVSASAPLPVPFASVGETEAFRVRSKITVFDTLGSSYVITEPGRMYDMPGPFIRAHMYYGTLVIGRERFAHADAREAVIRVGFCDNGILSEIYAIQPPVERIQIERYIQKEAGGEELVYEEFICGNK